MVKIRRGARAWLLPLLLVVGVGEPTAAANRFVTLASTTSTRDSGFFDSVLPRFEAKTGIQVRVVAVGTGRALRLAERGDVDAVLVHDRPSELAFVAEGHGIARREVMYNDFLVIGPSADPARVGGIRDAAAAFARIAESRAIFTSRGDDSGTHKAELRLWEAAGVDARAASGAWYRETGTGMGATLNTASELEAYLLADRGTWVSFKNRGDLQILVEGDPRLRNVYSAILVNPARHPHVKSEDASALVEWLVSDEGRAAIAAFRLGGMQLFHPLVPE
jgi:tungstate transport system substrate-binding protein